MSRRLLLPSLVGSVWLSIILSAPTLLAAELKVTLGIRQTLAADGNGDLVVGFDDSIVWFEHQGQIGANIPGDYDADGDVDDDDLEVWEDNEDRQVSGIIGDDGGTTSAVLPDSSDILWVNFDGQTLTADGTWQQFTFTPLTDSLTTLSSATGKLYGDWGTLEHIRFANTNDSRTHYKVWIDTISNTETAGTTTFGDFETSTTGDEAMFQEPSFSSTTSGNLLGTPDVAQVTDETAFTGSQSLAVEWEFTDDDTSRWLRLTTEDADTIPNPLIHLREGDYGEDPIVYTATTITFWAKAVTVPEVVPGDYNDDGMVNAADYTVYQDHLGATQTTHGYTLPNEAVTPGEVTTEDYEFWKDHFGDGAGSGAGSGSGLGQTAVPEPSGLALALASLAIVWLQRRQRST